jgi:hypothetical protein
MRRNIYRWVLACLFLFALPAFVYAQKGAVSYERAVSEAVEYLTTLDELLQSTGVGFVDLTDPASNLSRRVLREIESKCFGRLKIIEVEKQGLDLIKQELALSNSGMTRDDTDITIGHWESVQFYITISVVPEDNAYRLDIKATRSRDRLRVGDCTTSFMVRERLWFSAGVRAGVSLHFWALSNDITGDVDNPAIGFEPAVQGTLHFNDYIAVQAEVALSRDRVSYSGNDPEEGPFSASFESWSLQIPLLARFTYSNPDKIGKFVLGGFAGININIPLGDMKLNSDLYGDSSYRFSIPPNYVVGINPGMRLGPGLLFLDIRFYGDFLKTAIHDNSGTLALYSRNTVSFSLGYELEFKK